MNLLSGIILVVALIFSLENEAFALTITSGLTLAIAVMALDKFIHWKEEV